MGFGQDADWAVVGGWFCFVHLSLFNALVSTLDDANFLLSWSGCRNRKCIFHLHWCEVCLVEAFRSPHRVWISGKLIGKKEYLLWMTISELLCLFCCLLVSSIIIGQRQLDLPPLVREEEETADCLSPLPNGYSFFFFLFFTTKAESRKRLQIVCWWGPKVTWRWFKPQLIFMLHSFLLLFLCFPLFNVRHAFMNIDKAHF